MPNEMPSANTYNDGINAEQIGVVNKIRRGILEITGVLPISRIPEREEAYRECRNVDIMYVKNGFKK